MGVFGIAYGVIVWFVLALVIAAGAGSRGRSAFAYFLWSILFSPIGAFIILMSLTDDEETTTAGSTSSESGRGSSKSQAESWECPECGHSNPGNKYQCEECGFRLQ